MRQLVRPSVAVHHPSHARTTRSGDELARLILRVARVDHEWKSGLASEVDLRDESQALQVAR